MKHTYRVYFAQGNQALFEAYEMSDIFLMILKNENYYHSITKIEMVD